MKIESMPKDVSTILEIPSGTWTGNTMNAKNTIINTISRGDRRIVNACIRMFAMVVVYVFTIYCYWELLSVHSQIITPMLHKYSTGVL